MQLQLQVLQAFPSAASPVVVQQGVGTCADSCVVDLVSLHRYPDVL
jgi:hypothetical protein